MSCPNPETLERWSRGEISREMSATVQTHVGACSRCADLVAEIEANAREEARVRAALLHRHSRALDFTEPQAIGPYRLRRELGRGGMGVVFLAEDTRLGRLVAIKVLSAHSRSGAQRRRLEREARLLAALAHPNIATLYALEEIDGRLSLVMEHVDGLSLADRLASGPLDLVEALGTAVQVARALEIAHDRGVTHRDVKPANVMVTTDGHVKLLDFGLAHLGRLPGGSLGGTPGYMSPEQRRGESPGPTSDVWGLGALLYECMTGERPEGTPDEILGRLPEGVPLPVCQLLAACLSPNPDGRPAAVGALVRGVLEDAWNDERVERLPRGRGVASAELPGSLPQPVGQFVGRRRERLELARALRRDRVVTLVGTGGAGKTRLALELAADIADRFHDGIWFVELGPLEHGSNVAAAVAANLGLPNPGQQPVERIGERVRGLACLVLLDNCEHVIEGAAETAARLVASGAQILATSRERLGVPGELVYRVDPLPLAPLGEPASIGTLLSSDAERLFLERAGLAGGPLENDDAEAVARLCRALDGIPLAIELAASQAGTLGVRRLADRILSRSAPNGASRAPLAHQRTVRSSLEWSHDLLVDGERQAFASLAVFRGVFTTGAAIDVVGSVLAAAECETEGVVHRLVETSLVLPVPGRSEPSLRLLDTVRQYAAERLRENGDEISARSAHARHFLRLAETAEPELTGPEQVRWLTRLREAHADLESALECFHDDGDLPLLLRLTGALGRYWMVSGEWPLARAWCRRALQRCHGVEPSVDLASVHLWDGTYAATDGQLGEAHSALARALAIYRALGDRSGEARALNALGGLAYRSGSLDEARTLYARCLERNQELGDAWSVAAALNNLGSVAASQGEWDSALDFFHQSLSLRKQRGDDRGVAMSLNNLGRIDEQLHRLESAHDHLEESLQLHRLLRDRSGEAMVLSNLGRVAMLRRDSEMARAYAERGRVLRRELGDRAEEANSYELLALIESRADCLDLAHELLLRSLALRAAIGQPEGLVQVLRLLAQLEVRRGRWTEAARLWGLSESARHSPGARGPAQPWGAETPEWLVPAVQAIGAQACEAACRRGWDADLAAEVRALLRS